MNEFFSLTVIESVCAASRECEVNCLNENRFSRGDRGRNEIIFRASKLLVAVKHELKEREVELEGCEWNVPIF